MRSLDILIWNIPSIITLSWAGYMAAHETWGWGWFLAVGLLLTVFPLGVASKS